MSASSPKASPSKGIRHRKVMENWSVPTLWWQPRDRGVKSQLSSECCQAQLQGAAPCQGSSPHTPQLLLDKALGVWPPGKREWQKAFTALKSFVLHPLPKPGAQLYGLKIDQRALVFKTQSQCSSAADSFLSPLSWPLFRWIVPGLFSIPQEMKSNRCASPFSSGSCKRCLGIFVRFWFLLISFCFREDILGHLHICTSQMRIISFARTLTEFHRISFVYHFREWDNISV